MIDSESQVQCKRSREEMGASLEMLNFGAFPLFTSLHRTSDENGPCVMLLTFIRAVELIFTRDLL